MDAVHENESSNIAVFDLSTAKEPVEVDLSVQLYVCDIGIRSSDIYVQRKVRIGTIPELYLRIVRIPTLSADSGIVPDNSRIAKGVSYRFLL